MNRPLLILKILVAAVVIGMTFVGVYILSGSYDVAAGRQHHPLTHWVLDTARRHSIEVRARVVEPAMPDLTADTLHGVVIGYEEMCAGCHAPPGRSPSALERGLNPSPPDLARAAERLTPSTLFWVIKHGIRMSGMPAWGLTHSDDEVWALVALLLEFPGLQGDDYERMLDRARATGIGHVHDHGEGHDEHDH